MHNTRTNTTENVIKNEPLRAPYLLHHGTKHPEHKHIHDNMLPSCMHEHVSKELVNMKIGSHKKVQAKDVIEINDSYLA